jgi:hypothetical protein
MSNKINRRILWRELDELGLRILNCKGADSKAVNVGLILTEGLKIEEI